VYQDIPIRTATVLRDGSSGIPIPLRAIDFCNFLNVKTQASIYWVPVLCCVKNKNKDIQY